MIILLLFLLLNFSLFLPRYFFHKNTSEFFPIKEIFSNKSFQFKKIINRFNEDIFRINFEFVLLVLVFLFLKSTIPFFWAIVISSFFYIFTLVLFYYHYTILGIYKTFPCIASDWQLIKQGLRIALNGYRIQLVFGFFLSLVVLTILVYINGILIKLIYYGDAKMLVLFCFSIIGVTLVNSLAKKTNPFVFKKEFDFNYLRFFTIQFSILVLQSNRFFCKKTKMELTNLTKIIENEAYSVEKDISLQSKPNIYFIAIESYGAILHEDLFFREKYTKLMTEFNQNLQSKNWHITSSFSKSPVSGGGSWMAYSSLLMGINITSDFLYRKLFYERKKYKTQSILAILNEFGYATNLIAAVGGYDNFQIEWDETLSFLGAKNVIKFKDLEYNGEKFNFGPSAPDQYMLHKSRTILKEKYPNQPISFFVETINSHADFETPTHLFSNWEECNSAERKAFKPTTSQNNNIKENYFAAIEYQIKTITEFVLTEYNETIFVIFGDHQPPLLTSERNSFKTPIHIIAKNKNLISDLKLESFVPTNEKNNQKTELSHENLKSLFLKNFFKHYHKQT